MKQSYGARILMEIAKTTWKDKISNLFMRTSEKIMIKESYTSNVT
jgi:hypothetical protein